MQVIYGEQVCYINQKHYKIWHIYVVIFPFSQPEILIGARLTATSDKNQLTIQADKNYATIVTFCLLHTLPSTVIICSDAQNSLGGFTDEQQLYTDF